MLKKQACDKTTESLNFDIMGGEMPVAQNFKQKPTCIHSINNNEQSE